MEIRDPHHDPDLARMQAAYAGDRETWTAVSRAMRDAMVAHAAETAPYYARLFGGGPPPDFQDIPLLTKDLVSEHFGEFFSRDVPVERRFRLATSGSSGNPFEFVRDRAQGALEDGSARRMLLWINELPFDLTTVWFGRAPAGRPGIRPMPPSRYIPEEMALEMAAWGDLERFILYGSPTIIDWAAEQVEAGISMPKRPLAVVTSTEMLSAQTEEHIRSVFGCPVHAWYGCQETGGYLGATVEGTDKYALNPLLNWVEVVDDEGRQVDPGVQGRVVLTDLNNWVFPFIRYEVGDLATWSADSKGGFPMIESLDGRSFERITLKSGRVFHASGFGGAVFIPHELGAFVKRYQLVQTGPDSFDMLVVWRDPPTPALLERITTAVRGVLDPETALNIVSVDEIAPDPSGKTLILKKAF